MICISIDSKKPLGKLFKPQNTFCKNAPTYGLAEKVKHDKEGHIVFKKTMTKIKESIHFFTTLINIKKLQL